MTTYEREKTEFRSQELIMQDRIDLLAREREEAVEEARVLTLNTKHSIDDELSKMRERVKVAEE